MPNAELQSIMKRDGRTHDRKTQEAIRLMAVERILEGEDVASVMESYSLCRTTAYKWLAKVRGRGRGKRALAARKGSGRPPRPSSRRARSARSFAGSMAKIRCSMVLILGCGRARLCAS